MEYSAAVEFGRFNKKRNQPRNVVVNYDRMVPVEI